MTITVENLLKSPLISELRVIAGSKGLYKEIRAISVMDAPDSYKWLKGGEFILTTGYQFGDDMWHLEHFIDSLIKAGSCCLGVKKDRFLTKIEPQIIELAEKNNFPLLEIPYRYGWSEIIAAFYEMLHNYVNYDASNIEPEFMDELLRAVRRGGQCLMDKMTERFDVPLALIYDSKKIIADNGYQKVDLIGEVLDKSPLYPDNMGEEILTVGEKYLTVVKIPANRIDKGEYLAVLSDNIGFISEMKKLFHLLNSLVIMEDTSMSERERIYRQFIIAFQSDKLTAGEIDNLKVYRGNEAFIYSGIILIKSDNALAEYDTLKKTLSSARLKNKGKTNTYMVENAAKGEAIVMVEFYPHRDELFQDWQYDLYEEIEFSTMGTEESHIGIGSFYTELNDIKLSYNEARAACEIGRILWTDKRCFNYPSLSVYDALRKTDLKINNLNYIMTINQAGFSFDGIEIVETFFEYGGYKKAAAKLFIHENTLRYRMQKIKDILHLDMDDPIISSALIFQMKLWRLLKAK
ncbi:MAG: PucR family transcriptional regulator ligand-binding domain-containing protein [Lachnospiraceae bacterium]|nr:PucR family transcriptional regulator ligand-binding domain-containing protein [Lachnospiraceae bacterium]